MVWWTIVNIFLCFFCVRFCWCSCGCGLFSGIEFIFTFFLHSAAMCTVYVWTMLTIIFVLFSMGKNGFVLSFLPFLRRSRDNNHNDIKYNKNNTNVCQIERIRISFFRFCALVRSLFFATQSTWTLFDLFQFFRLHFLVSTV